ncbi:hypothetical protein IE81DRAFT_340704 [Ceraceosorus guamensis]|uniref:Uncharacterized protein n=1 Tax=Ceraceosorus guamensis TaxID=1522189 RepID=A0A316W335_9BASI|nr:hypothetical protein IE81DRAFT_340704 [Ceraceosorus guamensis]PWN43508.1 hypothetical protein IE81DRAFT_340704 [Ceraceosorus guamensis]
MMTTGRKSNRVGLSGELCMRTYNPGLHLQLVPGSMVSREVGYRTAQHVCGRSSPGSSFHAPPFSASGQDIPWARARHQMSSHKLHSACDIHNQNDAGRTEGSPAGRQYPSDHSHTEWANEYARLVSSRVTLQSLRLSTETLPSHWYRAVSRRAAQDPASRQIAWMRYESQVRLGHDAPLQAQAALLTAVALVKALTIAIVTPVDCLLFLPSVSDFDTCSALQVGQIMRLMLFARITIAAVAKHGKVHFALQRPLPSMEAISSIAAHRNRLTMQMLCPPEGCPQNLYVDGTAWFVPGDPWRRRHELEGYRLSLGIIFGIWAYEYILTFWSEELPRWKTLFQGKIIPVNILTLISRYSSVAGAVSVCVYAWRPTANNCQFILSFTVANVALIWSTTSGIFFLRICGLYQLPSDKWRVKAPMLGLLVVVTGLWIAAAAGYKTRPIPEIIQQPYYNGCAPAPSPMWRIMGWGASMVFDALTFVLSLYAAKHRLFTGSTPIQAGQFGIEGISKIHARSTGLSHFITVSAWIVFIITMVGNAACFFTLIFSRNLILSVIPIAPFAALRTMVTSRLVYHSHLWAEGKSALLTMPAPTVGAVRTTSGFGIEHRDVIGQLWTVPPPETKENAQSDPLPPAALAIPYTQQILKRSSFDSSSSRDRQVGSDARLHMRDQFAMQRQYPSADPAVNQFPKVLDAPFTRRGSNFSSAETPPTRNQWGRMDESANFEMHTSTARSPSAQDDLESASSSSRALHGWTRSES